MVKLTPIVPILFYHGEALKQTDHFEEMFPDDLPEVVRSYLPSFRCEVLNLTASEISDLSVSLQTQAALWAMKYSRTEFSLALEALERLVKTLGQSFLQSADFKSIEVYLFSSSTLRMDELLDLINQRLTDSLLGEEIMTTAQMLIKEGEARGKAQGEAIGEARAEAKWVARVQEEKWFMAKKLLELGLSVEQIVQTTGLDKSEVESLKG